MIESEFVIKLIAKNDQDNRRHMPKWQKSTKRGLGRCIDPSCASADLYCPDWGAPEVAFVGLRPQRRRHDWHPCKCYRIGYFMTVYWSLCEWFRTCLKSRLLRKKSVSCKKSSILWAWRSQARRSSFSFSSRRMAHLRMLSNSPGREEERPIRLLLLSKSRVSQVQLRQKVSLLIFFFDQSVTFYLDVLREEATS